jgi:hypothetical protein
MTVFESVTGRPLEIDSADLVRTPTGYAVPRERLVAPPASIAGSLPAPNSPPPDDGPSASSRLVRLDDRLAKLDGLLARLDAREAKPHVQRVVRDEQGRISHVVSEPAIVK